MSRPLDFLGIGAAKAGTTSLFQHIRHHPGAWIPAQKELPFFTEAYWATAWPSFYEDYFSAAPPEALIGKITPRYMADRRIADRVARLMPKAKILVLLRHPVERAYSDWRMRRRVGHEARTFEEAVAEQIKEADLLSTHGLTPNALRSPLDLYLARGEYARILEPWFCRFPRDQILVEFTEEFHVSTRMVMRRIFHFLGLPCKVSRLKLERRHQKGGDEERFPGVIRSLSGNRSARAVWRLFPFERRIEWLRWLNSNVRYRRDRSSVSVEVRERLLAFYHDDVGQLEKLLKRTVLWSGFH